MGAKRVYGRRHLKFAWRDVPDHGTPCVPAMTVVTACFSWERSTGVLRTW